MYALKDGMFDHNFSENSVTLSKTAIFTMIPWAVGPEKWPKIG
jgi:hypothetical protein